MISQDDAAAEHNEVNVQAQDIQMTQCFCQHTKDNEVFR